MNKKLFFKLKQTELFYELCEIGAMVIGRDPLCDITLNYPDISRKHCQLMVSTPGGFVEVTDLDSRNGIIVNNHLTNKAILHINDVLQIGAVKLILTERRNPPENIIPYISKKGTDSKFFEHSIDMIGSETGIRFNGPAKKNEEIIKILGDDGGDLVDESDESNAIMLDSIPDKMFSTKRYKPSTLDSIRRTEQIPRKNVEQFDDPLFGQIIADYQLTEILDVTRYWKEYKGLHIILGDTKILRILNDEHVNDPYFETRFRREAKVSLKLEHENIIRPINSGKFNKTYYFLREFVETRRLEEIISKKGTLNPEIGLYIAKQLAQALSYAHKMKIIHRNINPSNVLMDKKGKVYLCDFGFAAFVDQPTSGSTLTGGTIDPRAMLFRSPELFHQTPYADEQSDVYSLCAVIYYALSGFPPFANIGEITDNTQPISLSLIINNISDDFSELISRGLEKNPFKRFEYTQEFCESLNKISK